MANIADLLCGALREMALGGTLGSPYKGLERQGKELGLWPLGKKAPLVDVGLGPQGTRHLGVLPSSEVLLYLAAGPQTSRR